MFKRFFPLLMPVALVGAAAIVAAPVPYVAPLKPDCATEQLRDMVGQTIMVGFPGDDENDEGVRRVRAQINTGLIGGIVLFPDNIRSRTQVKNLIAFLRNARSSLPPFVAVDQEGGSVQRLNRRNGYRWFPSASQVGRNPNYADPAVAESLYAEMAQALADTGFNMNLGPVVDLNTNPWNPVIGARGRSFSADPDTTTSLAAAFIKAHRAANVVTVAKHFPGHGSSHTDSHKRLPDISETWREVELEPYRRLAKDGLLDGVMVGHLYHPRFSDLQWRPASLSAKTMQALRNKNWLGFEGVVVSDDLEMGAVRGGDRPESLAVKAIQAGTDIVVFSNVETEAPNLGERVHRALVEAVCDGRLSHARIETAYRRIVELKQRVKSKTLAETP